MTSLKEQCLSELFTGYTIYSIKVSTIKQYIIIIMTIDGQKQVYTRILKEDNEELIVADGGEPTLVVSASQYLLNTSVVESKTSDYNILFYAPYTGNQSRKYIIFVFYSQKWEYN